MKIRTLAALCAALCLFAAGCSDDDGGDDSSDGDSTTTAADSSDGDEDATPSTLDLEFELNVEATPAGNSLVTNEGLTLYIYTEDTEDESVCTGGCAESWPPYAVSGTPTASDEVTGTVGTIERENGTLQATIEGRPLYTFSGDKGAGTADGQGASGVWYAVNAAGETIGT